VTVGKRGTYLHAGAPGTGLSMREQLQTTASPPVQASTDESRPPDVRHGYVLLLVVAVAALVIALW
jgi:hypothetical protein